MAEVAFRPARQLSEYKGKGASASRETLVGNTLHAMQVVFDLKIKQTNKLEQNCTNYIA